VENRISVTIHDGKRQALPTPYPTGPDESGQAAMNRKRGMLSCKFAKMTLDRENRRVKITLAPRWPSSFTERSSNQELPKFPEKPLDGGVWRDYTMSCRPDIWQRSV
jgi:hypothetical protein